jgi:hypothetical protein
MNVLSNTSTVISILQSGDTGGTLRDHVLLAKLLFN